MPSWKLSIVKLNHDLIDYISIIINVFLQEKTIKIKSLFIDKTKFFKSPRIPTSLSQKHCLLFESGQS